MLNKVKIFMSIFLITITILLITKSELVESLELFTSVLSSCILSIFMLSNMHKTEIPHYSLLLIIAILSVIIFSGYIVFDLIADHYLYSHTELLTIKFNHLLTKVVFIFGGSLSFLLSIILSAIIFKK